MDGKRAQLDVGGKSMQVEIADLVMKSRPKKVEKQKHRPAPTQSSDAAPEVGGELNLIGQRVEEALEESDKFLDQALLRRTKAVRLIHGFGTGTLRKELREYLRKHPGVVSFRPGAENEGGDGATIAILDV
jgi:DNA mismatch repair protein MutS2